MECASGQKLLPYYTRKVISISAGTGEKKMFPKEGRFVNAKRLKIIRNDDVFSGLDDKSVVEAGYSGGIWLSFESKRVLPLYAKKERVEARFQTAGQRRTAGNRTGLTSKCECWHCLLVRSDGNPSFKRRNP